MIEFGNLSEEEKKRFTEEINKNSGKSFSESEMQLWPEDDEDMVKEYFKEAKKKK